MNRQRSILHTLAALVATALPLLALGQATAPVPARPAATEAGPPLDPKAASFSLGLYFGGQLHGAGLAASLAFDELERGLKEGLAGKPVSETDKQRTAQWMHSGRQAIAARNRTEAGEFLAANARIDGVQTTASGLQYSVVVAGDKSAPTPKPADSVTVQYRGRLLDGSTFDSSDAHGVSARFNMNGGVIPGWREVLLMMHPGAQWRVFIPPDLAYGDTGRPNIPPGSALVFDIQLVKTEGPRTLEPGQAVAPARPSPVN